jgi:hypothetical protein
LPNRRSLYEVGCPNQIETRELQNRIHRNDQMPVDAGQTHSRQQIPAFTYDPEEGIYSYLAGSLGRRIWCDIPPSLMDEDGPPPYTRDADGLRSREYFQRRARSDRPAPIVRYLRMLSAHVLLLYYRMFVAMVTVSFAGNILFCAWLLCISITHSECLSHF